MLIVPLLFLLLLIPVNIAVYFLDQGAGFLLTLALFAYLILAIIYYYRKRSTIKGEMITFAAQYGQIQKQLMMDFGLPYAVTDDHAKLLWFNEEFSELTGKDKRQYLKSITALFPEISLTHLPGAEEIAEVPIVFGDRYYRAQIRNVTINSLVDKSRLLERDPDKTATMYSVVLFDDTELENYIQKYRDEAMVNAMIYLDNYDEALESVEDVRRSLLTALIDRKINTYFGDMDAIVRKFEKDKYVVFLRTSTLRELQERRFDILEEVKTVNIGNDMAVTLSIGIGAGNGSYTKNAEAARSAIDLALGRGGDQVVLRDGESITYFGGKSRAVEKSTRVKARVKAQALQEFIESSEKVVVMGHKILDPDAFGAAVGIARAALTVNKKAHIVVDEPSSSTRPLLELFRSNTDYDSTYLVSPEEAIEIVDEDTMVVVVDTNRPSYTACEQLLEQTETIVVFDHHRQSNEIIAAAVLSYVEPYASSACEMVAEILQYFADGVRLKSIEADALYAGMLIDTDNFMQKTGVRTFEAAAFLRRSGADATRVRKMFREDINDYRARGETIRNAEIYRDAFAIAVCPNTYVESPTIVGSQAANELLNIVGVKASFVLTEYEGKVYISARAIDEVNVQIIMERMGGGGHLNMAGVQLPGVTVEEAQKNLKQTLDSMLEAGEL